MGRRNDSPRPGRGIPAGRTGYLRMDTGPRPPPPRQLPPWPPPMITPPPPRCDGSSDHPSPPPVSVEPEGPDETGITVTVAPGASSRPSGSDAEVGATATGAVTWTRAAGDEAGAARAGGAASAADSGAERASGAGRESLFRRVAVTGASSIRDATCEAVTELVERVRSRCGTDVAVSTRGAPPQATSSPRGIAAVIATNVRIGTPVLRSTRGLTERETTLSR